MDKVLQKIKREYDKIIGLRSTVKRTRYENEVVLQYKTKTGVALLEVELYKIKGTNDWRFGGWMCPGRNFQQKLWHKLIEVARKISEE